MNFIRKNSLLQFKSDSLQFVKKRYGVNDVEKLKDSINALYEWIQKQQHFMKKDYSKEYLERIIIKCYSSIETAKKKIDTLCTFKTKLPKYYEYFDMDNSHILNIVDCAFLPRMTNDHSRVFMLKNRGQRYDSGTLDFFKYFIMLNEYSAAHDYASGFIAIFDYTENNVKELSKAMNYVELQETLTIVTEGYDFKITKIHYLTSSKWIDIFVGLLKKILGPTLSEIIVHENIESVYDYVPQDILPADYGGSEKPLHELSDKTLEVLKSDEFKKYFEEMKRARINESLKEDTRDYVGMRDL